MFDEIKILASTSLKIDRSIQLWEYNLKEEDIELFVKPGIWLDVYTAWSKFSFQSPQKKGEILEQPLWLSSWIRINNKPIYFTNAMNIGLNRVKDVYDQERG